jgi:ADP-ribosylglycohydrolase
LTIDERTKDKIKGAFFGAAFGDALGAAVEFKTKAEVKALYPGGLHRFDQIDPKNFSRSWQVGEWTDDMEQSLCVAQTLMACGKIEPLWLANRLIYWLETDGRGLGRHTHLVLTHPQFLTDPEAAAVEVWKMEDGRSNAANGALMRSFATGLWDFWSIQTPVDNATKACLVTHADSRCVNSCVMHSTLIALLLDGQAGIESWLPEENNVLAIAKSLNHDDVELHEAVTYQPDVRKLKLGTKIGYTYRALSSAVWALYNATSVDHGIMSIINEGGDADTNACVAGSLLGVKWGFESIPKHLVEGLVHNPTTLLSY